MTTAPASSGSHRHARAEEGKGVVRMEDVYDTDTATCGQR